MAPFGDYRVEFVIVYLPPPQLPGAPDPGSYSATIAGVSTGDGVHVATWSIPAGSPLLGDTYRVSATCYWTELGTENVWFEYGSLPMLVNGTGTPLMSAVPSTFQAGEEVTFSATACPGPNPVGASYRVEYVLSYVPLDGETASFSYTITDGVFGTSSVSTIVPRNAPTLSGIYLLQAECRGEELGADFLVHTYPPLQLNVAAPASPSVVQAVSCLAGNGRVDTNVVNAGPAPATYRIEFEGLSPRQSTLAAQDWWRMPVTGRADGDYRVVVKRDSTVVHDQTITVACDGVPAITTPEVQVVSACRAGLGYLLVQFANPTETARGYVMTFPNVPTRSTTAAAFGQSVRAITGRPNGTYALRIRTDGVATHTIPVFVDCS